MRLLKNIMFIFGRKKAMNDQIQETKLIVHIQNKHPIELDDLSMSMCALVDQYKKFASISAESTKSRDAKLYVTKVQEGSIIIELKDFLYAAAIPVFANFNTIIEFTKHLKKLTDTFYRHKPADGIEDKVSISDCNDIGALLAPVSKENSSQVNYTAVVNGNIEYNFHINSKEGKKITDNTKIVQEELKKVTTDDDIKERVLLTLYQARNMQNSKVGNKGIIESISEKAINITFSSDEIQEEMLSTGINPLTGIYEVDVRLQTIRGELKGYQIMKIHQYFDEEEN